MGRELARMQRGAGLDGVCPQVQKLPVKEEMALDLCLCLVPWRASHSPLAPKRHRPCFWLYRAEEQLTWHMTSILVP